jgi:hypothetical protein
MSSEGEGGEKKPEEKAPGEEKKEEEKLPFEIEDLPLGKGKIVKVTNQTAEKLLKADLTFISRILQGTAEDQEKLPILGQLITQHAYFQSLIVSLGFNVFLMVAPYLSVTSEKLEAWRQDSNNLAKDILLTIGESLMYVHERDKINAEINALKKRIELLEKENQIYDYLLNLANARIQELVEQIVAIRAALEEGVLGNGGKKQPARI